MVYRYSKVLIKSKREDKEYPPLSNASIFLSLSAPFLSPSPSPSLPSFTSSIPFSPTVIKEAAVEERKESECSEGEEERL